MNAEIITAAKSIPKQLEGLVASMFADNQAGLSSAASALRKSLAIVQRFMDTVKTSGGGASRRAQADGDDAPAEKRSRRSRRKSKRFPSGEFIFGQLRDNTAGLRPRAIADRLGEAAPGKHANVLAVTNTSLSRLKKAGMAVSNEGVWTLTPKGWKAAKAAKK